MRYVSALTGFVALMGITVALAQPAAKPPAFRDEVLKADEPSLPKDLNDFRKLIMGSEDAPTGERKKELMNKVPRWMIYRLTWPEIQEGRPGRDGKEVLTMNDVVVGTNQPTLDGVFKMLPNINRSGEDADVAAVRDRQRKFQGELRDVVLTLTRDVMKTSKVIARVNAARILHRLAELGHAEASVDLVRLIEDPNEHNAVKHWGVKGLNELFNQPASLQPAKDAAGKDVQRIDVNKALMALYSYLDGLTKVPPTALADMPDGEVRAIRYLRREAMRTLGAAGRPMVVDAKDKREGPIAGTIASIMVNAENTVSPAASFDEQVEATVALCQMQSRLSPSYRLDAMLFQMAGFVAQLDAAANLDAERKTQRWLHFASVLEPALKKAGTDLPANSPTGQYYKKIAPMIEAVLVNVFDRDKNTQAVGDLARWLQDPANAPKATAILEQPAPPKPN